MPVCNIDATSVSHFTFLDTEDDKCSPGFLASYLDDYDSRFAYHELRLKGFLMDNIFINTTNMMELLHTGQ